MTRVNLSVEVEHLVIEPYLGGDGEPDRIYLNWGSGTGRGYAFLLPDEANQLRVKLAAALEALAAAVSAEEDRIERLAREANEDAPLDR